jgi:hypothetical protein
MWWAGPGVALSDSHTTRRRAQSRPLASNPHGGPPRHLRQTSIFACPSRGHSESRGWAWFPGLAYLRVGHAIRDTPLSGPQRHVREKCQAGDTKAQTDRPTPHAAGPLYRVDVRRGDVFTGSSRGGWEVCAVFPQTAALDSKIFNTFTIAKAPAAGRNAGCSDSKTLGTTQETRGGL